MGKHGITLDRPPTPTIPDDTLAFVIGDHDDPNQIRAFWVRESCSSHLEIEGGGQKSGETLKLRVNQILTMATLLRETDGFAKYQAVRP
jgi:hypothetical protein